MKIFPKHFFIVFILLVVISCAKEKPAATTHANEPVNPNLSEEARSVLSFLYQIKGEKILTGQHNYGHELLRSTDSVKYFTGKLPAVWGSDLLGYDFGSKNVRQDVVEEAIRQHQKGSIITLMYHQVKPFDHDSLGFQKSVKGRVTDDEWKQIVTPGTEYYQMWEQKVDSIAGYLKQLKDAKVPVLWRPYHEMNGIWFWYGNRPGEEGYQKLWKMMYDRYVHHHQLNNLIWVWNPNAPRDLENDEAYAYADFFPGLDYVDILAADIYHNDYRQSHHDELVELGEGKLIAIGECGKLPTAEILEKQPEWVWFMDWARYIWTANDPDSVKLLYDNPRCMSFEELKTHYPKAE
ncbi:glycosyl hydrolase [Flexithrix dorotheae]|uniref:glycosyl hydrolase n=1 Tax=Flexithrix dorotheae TaxID=70993 RepID=UPI00035DF88A|nr:glycosyl hydrolase [Flexithrix dorotheae]